MKILDGRWLSKQYHKWIKAEADTLFTKHGRRPGLGVILVGENPASKAYIKTKEKVAKKCGFEAFDQFLPENATKEEVLAAINKFNNSNEVDGILLQLPVPKHLNSNELIDAIDFRKDADGLHPTSQGLLQRGDASVMPCTPLGSLALIDLAYSDVEIGSEIEDRIPEANLAGKHAVVIGRSILVGKPVASLLLQRNATVTQVHSKTKDIEEICSKADIIVAAVGVPNLVKDNWVKEGAIVIDVGINRLPSGSLTGDVAFELVSPKTYAITPVPRGVGPMTVAVLMQNTLTCYKGLI